jgi:hypothetical protein
MRRLAVASLLAASAATAGCASKAEQNPPTTLPSVSATVNDARGDAFDSNGSARRARPDVDIKNVTVTRNDSTSVRFGFSAWAPPRTPLVYEIFAQAQEVAGYDVVHVTRDGQNVNGYVAFENSAAKQVFPPGAFTVNGPTVQFDVPFDPILGANPFQWRATLSTGAGPQISDYLPSKAGLKTFPPARGG